MKCTAKIGTALVGGYLLGRTRKAKLALGLGMFLAGKKLSLDPKELAATVAKSPVLGGLSDQVRDQLVHATREAATKAVTNRANSLADSLQQRTRRLEGTEDEDDAPADEDDARAAGGTDEAEEHADDGRDDADREAASERPAPRRKAAPARSRTAKRPAAARKTAAKTTRASGGRARKAASAGTKAARGKGARDE